MTEKTEKIDFAKVVTVKHSSPAGDLLSALPSLKQLFSETGKRVLVYQQIGMSGIGYSGAEHPFNDINGDPVCMNKEMFHKLMPLIVKQEYIADFLEYTGQSIDIDLNKIRLEVFVNQPHGSIHHYLSFAFPQMGGADLSEKWIQV